MEWLTHGATAIGGVLMTLLGVLFWAWGKKNSIESLQQRDAYEFSKIQRSDVYLELSRAIDESRKDRESLRQEIGAMGKEIAELRASELDCRKKYAELEIENYAQEKKVAFLEARVRTLEAMIAPQVAPVSPLVNAVMDVAKVAIAEDKK